VFGFHRRSSHVPLIAPRWFLIPLSLCVTSSGGISNAFTKRRACILSSGFQNTHNLNVCSPVIVPFAALAVLRNPLARIRSGTAAGRLSVAFAHRPITGVGRRGTQHRSRMGLMEEVNMLAGVRNEAARVDFSWKSTE